MQVHLSGQLFVFPAQCACCGAMPQTFIEVTASKSTGKKVVHTTVKSWSFPYCSLCVDHVNATDFAAAVTMLAIIGTLLAMSYIWFKVSDILGLCVGLFGMVVFVATYLLLMRKAKQKCVTSCSCHGRAVSYSGWQGTCHMFEINSQKYALAFMVANRRKLVNVSPQMWQWLQTNDNDTQTGPTQVVRRSIT